MVQVYANILEALTSGLYNEINFAIREYLQNSYDAIKMAMKLNLPEPQDGYSINVQITKNNSIVTITDNGVGMQRSVLAEYTSIGGGTKTDPDLTGHKGIGKLSGLRFFETFIAITKPSGSREAYALEWDSGEMMRSLLENEEKMKLLPYVDFIREYVRLHAVESPEQENQHYTQIQLVGVLNEFKPQVTEYAIGNFIKTTLPVPFDDDEFQLSSAITHYLGEHLVSVPIFINDNVIYQPYNDAANLVYPLTYDIKYGDKLRAKVWVSWIRNTSEIIADKEIRGIRFRCKGICVGDRNLFANNCMPPGRDAMANWFTGEVVVVDSDIKPSAARDRFYEGDASRELFSKLKSTVGRNLSFLADVRSELSAAHQDVQKWRDGETKVTAAFHKKIRTRIARLKKYEERGLGNFDFSVIEDLSDILTSEAAFAEEKAPVDKKEITTLINAGDKHKLVDKMLSLKTEEVSSATAKAKKAITENINTIKTALAEPIHPAGVDNTMTTVYNITARYLDAHSVPYKEHELRDFIKQELTNGAD